MAAGFDLTEVPHATSKVPSFQSHALVLIFLQVEARNATSSPPLRYKMFGRMLPTTNTAPLIGYAPDATRAILCNFSTSWQNKRMGRSPAPKPLKIGCLMRGSKVSALNQRQRAHRLPTKTSTKSWACTAEQTTFPAHSSSSRAEKNAPPRNDHRERVVRYARQHGRRRCSVRGLGVCVEVGFSSLLSGSHM